MLGEIRSQRGFSYRIADVDYRTLCVAAWKEEGDPLSTVWTYFQRLVAFNARSLSGLIMAHSQPLNPIWRDASAPGVQRGGCQARGVNLATYCSPSQLARRNFNAVLLTDSAAWEREVPQSIKTLVQRACEAKEANPVPRAVDFANEPVTINYLSQRAHWDDVVIKGAGNWYVTDRQSREWPPDFVSVVQGVRTASASTLVRATLTVAQLATLAARRAAGGAEQVVRDAAGEVVRATDGAVRAATRSPWLGVFAVVAAGVAYKILSDK